MCSGREFRAVGLTATTIASHAVQMSVDNLVTDSPAANPAQITDPGLVNGWGISYSPTSPFRVSSNGGRTTNVYRVDPATQATTKVPLTVARATCRSTCRRSPVRCS